MMRMLLMLLLVVLTQAEDGDMDDEDVVNVAAGVVDVGGGWRH